ncbi:MAG: serine hydrolase [Bacteroidia bacterium]|nr:serine hydrolase [Bacteroidia bacterium]
MKVFRLVLLVLVLSLAGYGLSYLYRYMQVGAGYNAKVTCSCTFVSGFPMDSIKKYELHTVPYGKEVIDREAGTVTASLFGIVSKTAAYRPGLGCTLLNDITLAELQAQPQVSPATGGPDLLRDTTFSGIHYDDLTAALDRAFAAPRDSAVPRAVVVLYQGRVVAERYAPGISRETPLIGWSMTKSVTQAMVGLLVQDGKLDPAAPAPVSEWQADGRREITLDHLLRMSSGLRFQESYDKVADAVIMLTQAHGAGKYALDQPLEVPPGSRFSYSSGTTNILQEIIRRQVGDDAAYFRLPHERLFRPIGMYSAVLEPDASGTYVGSSYMYATARDWARFGQLYLQDGKWDGVQILPAGWAAYAASLTEPSLRGEALYGAQFWLRLRNQGLPPDTYNASGFEGQDVVIIPSRQLVIVRMGCDPRESYTSDWLFRAIVSAIPAP